MKKIFLVLLAMIMAFGTGAVAFAENPTSVPEGYIGIYTAADLYNIRNNLSGKYILMNHIDLSGYSIWNPIGNNETPFEGELNGNGYSITRLTTNDSLLGEMNSAIIQNISIVDCNIIQSPKNATSSAMVGAFASYSINSTFKNCSVSGDIQPCVRSGLLAIVSSCRAGGLVGLSKGTSFTNCCNDANINFIYDKISYAEIGGLVGGASNTTFESCYNAGSVATQRLDLSETENDNIYIGGFAGNADETTIFKNCYFINNFDFAVGKNPGITDNATALSETQMKTKDAYNGFDFNNVWDIADGYPLLKNSKVLINKKISLKYKESKSVFQDRKCEIISWQSSNSNVAVIDKNGCVECVGVGDATIQLKTEDGQEATVAIDASYSFWQKIIVYLFFGWIWY